MNYQELLEHAEHAIHIFTRYDEQAVLYCNDCKAYLIEADNPEWNNDVSV